MRNSSKQEGTGNGHNQVFGVDFHDFIQKQENNSNFELADEFGLSLRGVKELKQRLGRN
ncbi:RNA polymerase subunit sigma-70 [Anaerobacillus sp. MEB173]|uniref:RNA polymerase subunit sigma-70 n=1 Tax=Anaerobacillus sp. MEB173 TaxID=3383345 RepID=UPI003F908727